MGVYIKDMEMPKTGRYFVAVDNTDGKDKTVISVMSEFERGGKTRPLLAVHEVIPVPPHGRLGDLDALKSKAIDRSEKCGEMVNVMDKVITVYDILTAPTIIPAEPCNNLSKPCKEDEP